MAQENETGSTQLFQFDAAAASTPVSRPGGGGFLRGVVTFCSVAVMALMISTGVIWLANYKPRPNGSADRFLWFAGQNKTWDQYQNEQRAAGRRGPEGESELDWMQQLLNDAYSR